MARFSQTILRVFEHSPFNQVWQHMAVAHECCALVPEFFQHAQSGQWDQADRIFKSIAELESEADRLKKEIIMRLHKRHLLSLSRFEAISLLQSQDSIANQAEDITGIVLGRRLMFPEPLTEPLLAYVDSAVMACAEAKKVVSELQHVQSLLFSRSTIDHLDPMVHAIDDSEHRNDDQQRGLRRQLIEFEKQSNPIEVMFMYDVVSRIGQLADCAHHVGSKFIVLLT